MPATAPEAQIGMRAPEFRLPAVDGRTYALGELAGRSGTVIVFICNHCPYVRAMIDRLVSDAAALEAIGVSVAAICSNDPQAYPEDSFENMKRFAAEHRFGFPYLHDWTQETARAYGAVCTPDFFGFNAALELQYRGRLDAGRTGPVPPGSKRELFDAMEQIAQTGKGPVGQIPSMGCSIKWREAA